MFDKSSPNTPSLVANNDDHDQKQDMIFVDSFQGSDGYISTISTKGVKRKSCECSDSLRWDKPCSSFDCPKQYFPVEDADINVCENSGCSKQLCCAKGEMYFLDIQITCFSPS